MGVPRRKGGSRLSLQSFLAEKAKKGFPLQPLTQATQKSEKFQLNQSIIFLHSGQAVVANDNKNQRIPEIRDKPAVNLSRQVYHTESIPRAIIHARFVRFKEVFVNNQSKKSKNRKNLKYPKNQRISGG